MQEGEVWGLLGPTGAGKTTLLRLLFGLMSLDAGSIELLGRPLVAPDSVALQSVAGFVEDPSFYPYLSGRANLELLAELDDGPGRRSTRFWSRWNSPGRVGIGSAATQPGCASDSGSRRRCCAARDCCCSMSRPTDSISRARGRAGLLLVGDQPLLGLGGALIAPGRCLALVLVSWLICVLPVLTYTSLAVLFSVATRNGIVGVLGPMLVALAMQLLNLIAGACRSTCC